MEVVCSCSACGNNKLRRQRQRLRQEMRDRTGERRGDSTLDRNGEREKEERLVEEGTRLGGKQEESRPGTWKRTTCWLMHLLLLCFALLCFCLLRLLEKLERQAPTGQGMKVLEKKRARREMEQWGGPLKFWFEMQAAMRLSKECDPCFAALARLVAS